MSSDIISRVKFLCQKHGTTVNELARNLGLSSNTIPQWDKSSPSVDKIKLVANHFNVSVDYILGLTEIATKPDDLYEDQEILTLQRLRSNMSSRNRNKMMDLLRLTFEEDFPKDRPKKEEDR